MNRTTFDLVLQKIISFWPENIEVQDKILFDNGGARIVNLTNVHDAVLVEIENDEELYNRETGVYNNHSHIID